MTFILFWGYLRKARENFQVSSSIIWEWERWGKVERGRDEGYGKWVELADLPTLHLTSMLLAISGYRFLMRMATAPCSAPQDGSPLTDYVAWQQWTKRMMSLIKTLRLTDTGLSLPRPPVFILDVYRGYPQSLTFPPKTLKFFCI